MKALFIGGTGNISEDVSKLALKEGIDLTIFNRGNYTTKELKGVKTIKGDIKDINLSKELLQNKRYDVVVDFIAFNKEDIKRDYEVFKDKTNQFIFISSASVYQKPPRNYYIKESTPLVNPYWKYSRDKIEAEDCLKELYRKNDFPITIVRPSSTYSDKKIPVGVHGKKGSFQVVKRMMEGKEVIIHGDGLTLWTLTHSEDFAKGFVGLMNNPHAIGSDYHITSDEVVNYNDIYEMIAGSLGVKLKPVHITSDFLKMSNTYNYEGELLGDKSNSLVFDNTKIKEIVPKFKATISVKEMIERSVKYVLRNKELQTEDEQFDEFCDRIIKAQTKAIEYFKKSCSI